MSKEEKYAGITAGLSLIIMALVAGFSYGFVQNQLLGENATQTAQNIAENQDLFLTGVAGWVVILLTDIIVAGALFLFFKGVKWRASMLAAVCRILYSLVLGIAIYRLVLIIPLIGKLDADGEIYALMNSFEDIWSTGLIIFGFHLILLGFLSLHSKHLPKFLGYLLYFAGAAYTLIPAVEKLGIIEPDIMVTIENLLALPMALGELLLAFWLIFLRNK